MYNLQNISVLDVKYLNLVEAKVDTNTKVGAEVNKGNPSQICYMAYLISMFDVINKRITSLVLEL